MCEQPPAHSTCSLCQFLCKDQGRGMGVCLEKFLVSLGKCLFARLHKIGEALCPLDGETNRGW